MASDLAERSPTARPSRARTLAIGAFVLTLCAPLAAVEAKGGPKFCRNGQGHPVHGWQWCVDHGFVDYHRRYDPEYERRSRRAWGRGYASAWDVVRDDPCRLNEYRRFAAEHENPRRRSRFLERIARDGCDDRAYARYYGDDWDRRDRGPRSWLEGVLSGWFAP
jgi:hypothetical protein